MRRKWFLLVLSGQKTVEFRPPTRYWSRRLEGRQIDVAVFSCGYCSRDRFARKVLQIDRGPCPIDGWEGEYIRVHLGEMVPVPMLASDERKRRGLLRGGGLALVAAPMLALSIAASDGTSPTAEGERWLLGAAGAGGAILAWLKIRDMGTRKPPVQEELYRDYVRRDEWERCRGQCHADMDTLRASIAVTDRTAEERAKGSHARIDALYRESQRTNRALGKVLGVLVAQGKMPPATIVEDSDV
jgi:hypothetical protein